MRAFSNFCLGAAIFTRRFNPAFRFFIAAAFKTRKWEVRFERESPVEQVDDFPQRLSTAVRMGLNSGGREGDEYTETATVPEAPISKGSLEYSILWGDEGEHVSAMKKWKEHFPDDPLPQHVEPVYFERISLNGSFKVTPKLRAKLRAIRKGREGCEILVVVNKTNTTVALGLGQLGNQGGVIIPAGGEPFTLTDHFSFDQWIDCPDLRQAVAKDWLAVVAANPRKKFLKASPKAVQR